MHYVLLTGATGHLGKYLLQDLLRGGQPVAAVVRENGAAPSERLQRLTKEIRRKSETSIADPVCISGDTTLPNFGMSAEQRAWLKRNCRCLLHNAASVQFDGGGSQETLKTNLLQAQQAIELFHSLDLPHMIYVSTAYVCGRQSGTIYEDQLDLSQSFRNEYEQSKYESEKLIRRSIPPNQLTVIRPSIIVGDYQTGETNQYFGVYQFAQFTSILASAAPKDHNGCWEHNVRLTVSPSLPLNLVPVDWVSKATVEILKRRQENDPCNTYHLTPAQPTSLGDVEAALKICFQYRGVRFVPHDTNLSDATDAERLFYDYVSKYLEYWCEDPIFDRTNTNRLLSDLPDPRIDLDCLVRLFRYAIKQRFGRVRRKIRVC